MSSFFVGNLTLSRLARTIYLFYPKIAEELKAETPKKIAKLLYKLNVEALKQRYEDYQTLIEPFVFIENPAWNLHFAKEDAQFFMSLCCFLYQCCEGNVPKKKAYKILDELKDRMAMSIAIRWAEEKGARWV
jgi:hypothetical protein